MVYVTGMTLMTGSLNLSIFSSEPEGRGGFDIARDQIIDNNNNNNNNDRVNLEYTVDNVDQLAGVIDDIRDKRGFIIINLNNNVSEDDAKQILQKRLAMNNPEGEIENLDGQINDFYEAAPNVDGTYEINNARQLYWFANEVYNGRLRDANVMLTADIDLTEVSRQYTWRPIGSDYNTFVGTFNGDGHVITGLYCKGEGDMGLFGVLARDANAEVKNVNIEGSTVINNGYGCVGIISASNERGGVIRNCNVINSSVFGKYEVGGISGCSNGRIENCNNEDCKVVECSGGGYADESYGIAESYGEIIRCENNGLVITIKNVRDEHNNNNMAEPNPEEQIEKANPDAPAGRQSPEEVETDMPMGRQAPGFQD